MDEEAKRSIRAIKEKINDVIERCGHAVISTEADVPGGKTMVSYTVGLAEKGLDEIVVYGLNPTVAVDFLNNAAEAARSPDFAIDEPNDAISNFPIVFKKIKSTVATGLMLQAQARKGGRITAMQAVWPDNLGKFPWDEGYDDSYLAIQPLLFEIGRRREKTFAKRGTKPL